MVRSSRTRSLVSWLLLAVGVVPAAAQEPEPVVPDDTVPPGPEVETIRFPGADTLPTDLLEDAIATKATECRSPLLVLACIVGDWDWAEEKGYLDRAELPDDVERIDLLYEIWGFPDARASSRVIAQPDGDVIVEFPVEEGRPIRVAAVEVRGLESLEPPVRLPRPLPLDEGKPYALPLLDVTQQIIRDSLAERGRPFAEIEVEGAVDEAARTARVVLQVAPGPEAVFGPVVVQTEQPIEEEVVRERLAYRPGDPFRVSALAETRELLFQLPVVERVVVEPLLEQARDTVVPTRVAVAARKVQGVEFEGTLSSTECLELAGFWNHRYFLGDPRLFSLGVGVSNLFANQADGSFPCSDTGEGDFADPNYFVRAEAIQPWPGSPRTTVLVGAFVNRESAPNTYIQEGYGGRLGVSRRFRNDWTASALYEPRNSELDAAGIFFCGNFGVCTAEGIDELSEFTWLSPLQLLALYTPPERVEPRPGAAPPFTTIQPYWRRWFRGGLDVAQAFTGSEFDYVRSIVEGALTRIFGERFSLAGHSRIGILGGGDVVPPQVRLYSGGVNTVRGVEQNLLGPRVLVTADENALASGCALELGGCPAGLVVDPDLVAERPLGGELVTEANLEGRMWMSETLQLAAFVDFGLVSRELFSDNDPPFPVDDVEALVTPGVGIRIWTGLGPVRVDLGYDPSGGETLPLLTEAPEGDRVLFLGTVNYDPFTYDDPGLLTEIWRRLQLHVAIGQPF